MTMGKRIFDILFSTLLILLLSIPMCVVAIIILIKDGRPVFYVSERMKSPKNSFMLFKYRTMKPEKFDSGVSGAHKVSRITRTGRILRKTRMDEVPQLFNILVGDMSFVGPRPPLREYVVKFPTLYRQVLVSKPGVTGLASLRFHTHEERVLSRAKSDSETDRLYSTLCVPRKGKLDLIYQKNRSICFDIRIIAETIISVFK